MHDDLSHARWLKAEGDPAKHTPRDALVEVLRRIDTGELDADHIVVCIAERTDDGSALPTYFQGGPCSVYAQIGLLRMCASLVEQP